MGTVDGEISASFADGQARRKMALMERIFAVQ
jgi:hypothetical protein